MNGSSILRILVVDDEPAIAETLAAILQNHGYSVESFTNPLEALKSTAQQTPDLLISDVTMPQLSGIDLAIQIQSRFPDCEILLISGHGPNCDLLRQARQRGYAFSFLSKPIHPTVLLREIEHLCSHEHFLGLPEIPADIPAVGET